MSDLAVFRTTTAVFRARRSWPVCIGIAPITSVSHKDHKAGNATASLACWLPGGNALSMVDFAECASGAQRGDTRMQTTARLLRDMQAQVHAGQWLTVNTAGHRTDSLPARGALVMDPGKKLH